MKEVIQITYIEISQNDVTTNRYNELKQAQNAIEVYDIELDVNFIRFYTIPKPKIGNEYYDLPN